MQIAFFSKNLPPNHPNGVSVQVDRLARALVERGHTVTIYSLSPSGAPAPYQHVQLKLPAATFPVFKKIATALLFRNINVSKFSIVHYHGDDYLCTGSARRVRTFYGSALQEASHALLQPGRFFYQSLFYLFEWVSCLKKGNTVAISHNTRCNLPSIKHVIPCCIPLKQYQPDSRKSSTPSILFLGDLTSRKRGALLIRTFLREVLPTLPSCILTVVGPVRCSGKNIIYAGNLTEADLIAAYKRSWICCVPSSYEGFGVPMLEAMACGTAVVATKNAGSCELLQHNRTGLLCTPALLGTTLIALLRNHEQRASLVAAGLTFVQQFDCSNVAASYEQLYTAITQRVTAKT